MIRFYYTLYDKYKKRKKKYATSSKNTEHGSKKKEKYAESAWAFIVS